MGDNTCENQPVRGWKPPVTEQKYSVPLAVGQQAPRPRIGADAQCLQGGAWESLGVPVHAVSRRDDPFTCQHRTSAVVLGAMVHADLPGPAPQGHVRPPNHPPSTRAQPAFCKAAREQVLGRAPGARPSGWRMMEAGGAGAKKLLDPGGDLGDVGEERGTHLSISEPQFDPIHSCSCTGISLWSAYT